MLARYGCGCGCGGNNGHAGLHSKPGLVRPAVTRAVSGTCYVLMYWLSLRSAMSSTMLVAVGMYCNSYDCPAAGVLICWCTSYVHLPVRVSVIPAVPTIAVVASRQQNGLPHHTPCCCTQPPHGMPGPVRCRHVLLHVDPQQCNQTSFMCHHTNNLDGSGMVAGSH